MSKTFYMIVVLVCTLHLYVSGAVAKYHLKIEQEWSSELQSMVDHDMVILANQKEYIHKLELLLGE